MLDVQKLKNLLAKTNEKSLKDQLTFQIQHMKCEEYAKACISVDSIFIVDGILVVNFCTDNIRDMCVPCRIEDIDGEAKVILDAKEYERDYKNNMYYTRAFHSALDSGKATIVWQKKQKKEPKVRRYTLDDFKLEPQARKYFSYGPLQQRLLKELVEWHQNGGNAFGEESIDFFEIPSSNMADPELYKHDPIHAGDMSSTVKLFANRYKWTYDGKLYRGISKAEYDGILKHLKNGKTTFKRDKITSFTANLSHAKKFAKYGGGSIVDTKIKRQPGVVLTIQSDAPLFFIDEFVFYECMSLNIAGLDDTMSQKEALMCTMLEEEWLVPADYTWRVLDKDNLVFKVSKT